MNWELILSNTASALVGWEVVAYSLTALGLNIHFGYTGLLNFGQAGFMAVGAYGVAISVSILGLPLALSFLIAVVATIILALLLGIPTLRLRADYLAIVTLASAEILRLIFRSASLSEYTGGSDGLQGFVTEFRTLSPFRGGSYDFGPLAVTGNVLWVITVGWTLVALSALLIWLLMRSPWGRVLKGIREDEDAVRSLGKNVFAYKLQSLMLGGLMGALGGMVFAFAQASANPDNFSPQTTFFAFTILILGGAARVFGPIVGALIFWASLVFIENFLFSAIEAGVIPASLMSTTQASQIRFILVGLVLMLLMIYRPQGIFGDKRELQLDAR